MEKKSPEVLGIVGIRSGSRGVPNKNVRPLAGKPLVGWIIEKALQSKYINRMIISTDSAHYAEVARAHGAEVPYLRPLELAADNSPEFLYVKHMVEWLEKNENYKPEIVVRMMATVPLQMTEDIDASIEELLTHPEADSCVVIAEARQHPMKALKLVDDEKGGTHLVTYFTNSGREVTPLGRQSYEKAYFRANIITCRTKTIFETASLTGDHVRYHIIPQERAVDIDSEADFTAAEGLMREHFKTP
jgi:CMP-N-acetylneuraminic acid synthetase